MLGRLLLSMLSGLLVLPIFFYCIYPLVYSPHYLTPFSGLTMLQFDEVLLKLVEVSWRHVLYTLYAIGAYVVSIWWVDRHFLKRKELILQQLNRLEQ